MNAQPRTDTWAASNAHSTVHYRLQAEAEPDSLCPDWFEVIVDEVAACSGLERGVVREKCLFWGSLVDSLKYIQLGRPEKIRLRPHSLGDVISAMLAEKSIPQSVVPMMDFYPGLFLHSEQFIPQDFK